MTSYRLFKHLSPSAQHRGITLIELMVSMSISLVLMGAIFQLYLSAQQSSRTQATRSEMQENGIYALSLIVKNVRRAGYFGLNSDPAALSATIGLTPAMFRCIRNNQWGRMLEQPIFGLNNSNHETTERSYKACIPSRDYIRGDIITLRSAAPLAIRTSEINKQQNNQRLYLHSSLLGNRILQGKEINAKMNNTPASIFHELTTNAYYVGPVIQRTATSNCSSKTPHSALYRKYLNNRGRAQREELVIGIENLQIRYGVDFDDDSAIDRYLDAHNVSDWQHVLAARIWVLARASCPEPEYINDHSYEMADVTITPRDKYRRALYQQTVALRGRAH